MPLTQQEKNFIDSSIRCVLDAHRGSPFFILREAGVVAELRSKLMAVDGPFGGGTPPDLIEKSPFAKGPPRYVHVDALVSRVQMEITVNARLAEIDRVWKKTLDIAILSERPRLLVYENGPGDVVEQVSPQCVAAAFEVKASPSADHRQRGLYVKDILALLWLRREYDIPGYFVLLDKSQDLYGTAHQGLGLQTMVWETGQDQLITIRSPEIHQGRRSLAAWNLRIDDVESAQSVELWMIDTEGRCARRRHASFIDERTAPAVSPPLPDDDSESP